MPMKTGNYAVDRDHELLLKAIDDIVVAMLRGEPRERVLAACHAAFDFFREHFAREERIVGEASARDLTVLRNEHARLLSRMSDLRAQFEADPEAYRDSESVGEIRRIYLRQVRDYDAPILSRLEAGRPAAS